MYGSVSTLQLSGPSLMAKVIRKHLAYFLAEDKHLDHKSNSYFTQINPLARIDLVSFYTGERSSSWVAGADKTQRYTLIAGQDSRYINQIILQLGNSINEASASLYLGDKYRPDFSQLIRLKSDGTLIDSKTGGAIEPGILQASFLTDDTRIIVVGHGTKVQDKKTGFSKFLLGGKTARELAEVLGRITGRRSVKTVSLVGCGADASGEHYPVEQFARQLIAEIRTERITVRNALVAVDDLGRKWTGALPAEGDVLWSQSDPRVKLVLEKDKQGQLITRQLRVAEGLVKKLRNLPALPPGRDYAYLGKNDRHFNQARDLLLTTIIENNREQPQNNRGQPQNNRGQPLSRLIEDYNLRLQQVTRDNFSPYRLMPLPAADVELPFAQAGAPRELHLSAFVRADSIGDPFSGVGMLAYGNPFAQENFFRTQQAGYQLARQVASPPSEAMAALFTRLLLGSLQDIVTPAGHDIDPFRVSSPDLLVSVLGKDDLFALYAHKERNDFSELARQYVKALRELSGDFLADKRAEQKVPRLNAWKRREQRKSFQSTLSLGVKKRLMRQPDGTVSFTDPVSLPDRETFAGNKHGKYLPVVTNLSGETYVLVSVPEINSAVFPDNLRDILFMLQSSGPLEQRNAQTLIKTIESAYSHRSPSLAEQRLDEKMARLPLADVITLANEIDNFDTEHRAAQSLMRKLLLRLVDSVVKSLENGDKPNRQQKLLIAELSNRLPEDNRSFRIPLSGKP